MNETLLTGLEIELVEGCGLEWRDARAVIEFLDLEGLLNYHGLRLYMKEKEDEASV